MVFVGVLVAIAIRFSSLSVQLLRVNFVQYTPRMLTMSIRSAGENVQSGNMYEFRTAHDAFCEQMLISVMCSGQHYKAVLESN